MKEIGVRELSKEDHEEWDRLVDKSDHGTIFHKSAWLTTCSESLNKQMTILGCFQGDRLVGGCSFFSETKAGFLKTGSSSCGMTPYGGVVLRELNGSMSEQETGRKKAIRSICESINSYRFDDVRLTNPPGLIDVRPFTWNGWRSNVLYAYYLDSRLDFETHVERKAMSHIAKAIKSGIKTRKSDDLTAYWRLFSMTFHRQGLKPPVHESFFSRIFHMLKDRSWGEMWIAETSSGEIACAEMLVWDNKRAYAWSAASHTALRRTGATSLLLYREFNDLKSRGIGEYNLMSANTPHLASFNSSFNPRLVPYYEVEKYTLKFGIARRAAAAFRDISI